MASCGENRKSTAFTVQRFTCHEAKIQFRFPSYVIRNKSRDNIVQLTGCSSCTSVNGSGSRTFNSAIRAGNLYLLCTAVSP